MGIFNDSLIAKMFDCKIMWEMGVVWSVSDPQPPIAFDNGWHEDR